METELNGIAPEQKKILRLISSLQAEEQFGDARMVHQLLEQVAELRRVLAEKDTELVVLRKDAMSDHLTGLVNRRVLEKEIGRAIAASARKNTENALLFVDLNGFKAVNDNLGHDAGDAVLKHVAHLLRQNTRPSDVVSRLGGDEFCVLMPEVASQHHILERVKMLAHVITETPCVYQGQTIQIAASIGYHFFGSKADITTVLKKADADMYSKKPESSRAKRKHTEQSSLF